MSNDALDDQIEQALSEGKIGFFEARLRNQAENIVHAASLSTGEAISEKARGALYSGITEALKIAHRVADAAEVAWLIESKFKPSPKWWNGVPEGQGPSYTADPNAAVRFARREDAEGVAKHLHHVFVTEHKWLDHLPQG